MTHYATKSKIVVGLTLALSFCLGFAATSEKDPKGTIADEAKYESFGVLTRLNKASPVPLDEAIKDCVKDEFLGFANWCADSSKDETWQCIAARKGDSSTIRFYFHSKDDSDSVLRFMYVTNMSRFVAAFPLDAEKDGKSMLLTVWALVSSSHFVVFSGEGGAVRIAWEITSQTYPEIADLDDDGFKEIVTLGSGRIQTDDSGRRQLEPPYAFIYERHGEQYSLLRRVTWHDRFLRK